MDMVHVQKNVGELADTENFPISLGPFFPVMGGGWGFYLPLPLLTKEGQTGGVWPDTPNFPISLGPSGMPFFL